MDENEILRWRARHASHDIAPSALSTGGPMRIAGLPRITLERRIQQGLECRTCREVLWHDELRSDEPFR